ncbi:MAG TPA: tetratricopeptide repeat protein [Phycisphaerae bacterium]|nr:tetratricopeptide repeat protein [Phycisphaerae bacterium]
MPFRLALFCLSGLLARCPMPVIFAADVPASQAPQPLTKPSQDLLKQAQDLLVRGAYEEAAKNLEELAADPEQAVEAAIGLAEARRMVGRYADALAVLERVNAVSSDSWQLARAEVLSEIGRYGQSIEAAGKAIELNSRNTSARRLLGHLYEITGDRLKAIEAYAWFEALLRKSYPTTAVALTDSGIAIYRHAVLTRSPQTTARTKYVLQELLQPAVERLDKEYWPALLASGELLLSKYNLEQAGDDFKAAIKINPNLAMAHVGLGTIALDQWDFEKAAEEAAAALKINPHSPDAHCLQARIHLLERKDAEAVKAAAQALDTNPNHLEALGILAAARLLHGDKAGMQETVSRAEKVNPRNAIVPNEVASWLAMRNQFSEAEPLFKKAAELAPEWADPLTGLGMLYMETGDEAAARRVLDSSWKLDPFNEKTFHTLNLLDKLEKFGHEETEHFIVKSADGPESIIRPMVAAYAEEIYARVCDQYNYRPPRKTIIEVFPEHGSFAVRVTGRPFLHTIGATTGPVIALDAPRSGPTSMTFNWPTVLRHEFVHTVTLAATGNRVPRWLTEGLAQREEGRHWSWEWCQMLVMALRRGMLYDLNSIDWGFVRPKHHGGPMLAYAQSEWMVDYIIERHGQGAIGTMLAGFRDAARQDEIVRNALGQSPEAFMRDFTAWASKQAESWGQPLDPIPPIEEIDRRLVSAKDAEKVALLVSKAEALLDNHELDEAAKALRDARKINDRDARVLTVMVQTLWAQAGQSDKKKEEKLRKECIKVAEELAKRDPDNPTACWVLGSQAIKDQDRLRAVEMFARVVEARPRDLYSRSRLAELYIELKQPEKALAELIELARLDSNEESYPLRAARIHADAGRGAEAVEWYRKALMVAPYDKDTHEALGQLLMREQRFLEAIDAFRVVTQLKPASAEAHSRLAFALYRAGRTEEAKGAAKRAVSLDPQSDAKSLLEDQPRSSSPSVSPPTR